MTAPPEETATARAEAFAPAPGRSRWLLAARCPFCGFTHSHSAERWFGGPVLKSPRCRPWRTYRVQVTSVDLTGGTGHA
ncbi:hypothetical protein DFQ14_12225 [Halopolyspora algeriensis]|uniref:Uncharacterized protein n=1 Tax=Halopolyspora algeriensis TaxID=1500506 RepID=A0A368VBI8_9ACTN|nr:hypothetical protein [Halopolyspora algeriensis]RCW38482.1 hypothetical protein DFQ14_12225 [Halopolyspora algeriensis]TQM42637.1 hypothetical protein FHU43_4276 [Halopolyspora algeriensis]